MNLLALAYLCMNYFSKLSNTPLIITLGARCQGYSDNRNVKNS